MTPAFKADMVRIRVNDSITALLRLRTLINMQAPACDEAAEALDDAVSDLREAQAEIQRLRQNPEFVTSTGDMTKHGTNGTGTGS